MKKNLLILTFFITLLINAQNKKPAVFHVIPFPATVVSVNLCKDTNTVTSPELLNCNRLICKMGDLSYKIEVVSFEITINIKGNPVVYTNFGSKIRQEAINSIQLLKPGTKIFFYNVK